MENNEKQHHFCLFSMILKNSGNLFLLIGMKHFHFTIFRYPMVVYPFKKYGVWARHFFRILAISGNRVSNVLKKEWSTPL